MANQPETGVSPVVLVGGVVLLAAAVALAYREYHKNHPSLPPEARPRDGGSDEQPEEAMGQDTGSGKSLLERGADLVAGALTTPSKEAAPPADAAATNQSSPPTRDQPADTPSTPVGDIASVAAAHRPWPTARPSARANRYNLQVMRANGGQWRDAIIVLRALGHQFTHGAPSDARTSAAIARFQVAYAADAAANPSWQPRSLAVDGEMGPSVKAALRNYRPMLVDVMAGSDWES